MSAPVKRDKLWFLTSEEFLARHPLAHRDGLPSPEHSPPLLMDAPGLWSSLCRHFHEEAMPGLEAAYAHSIARGGKEEWPVVRPEDASFNPRPARVCQILFAQGRCADLDTLIAALLAPMPPEEEAFESWRDAHQRSLARAASGHVHQGEPLSMPGAGRQAAWSVALALALDTVRHLHMTELPAEERRALLDRLQPLAGEQGDGASSPLAPLLQSALTQQFRRLDSAARPARRSSR